MPYQERIYRLAVAATFLLILTAAALVYILFSTAERFNSQSEQNGRVLKTLEAAISAGPANQRSAVIVNLRATACMLLIQPEDRTVSNISRCVDRATEELRVFVP